MPLATHETMALEHGERPDSSYNTRRQPTLNFTPTATSPPRPSRPPQPTHSCILDQPLPQLPPQLPPPRADRSRWHNLENLRRRLNDRSTNSSESPPPLPSTSHPDTGETEGESSGGREGEEELDRRGEERALAHRTVRTAILVFARLRSPLTALPRANMGRSLSCVRAPYFLGSNIHWQYILHPPRQRLLILFSM